MTGTLKVRVGGQWVPVSGENEVEVSPTDPITTNPTAELWYDSDGVAPVLNDQRWNTAWGVIAVGTAPGQYVGVPAATATDLTNVLAVTLLTGRRYKVIFFSRAISGPSNGSVGLMDGAAYVQPDPWQNVAGNYGFQVAWWMLTGDDAVHNFKIRHGGNNGSAITYYLDSPGFFTVEDVGPASGTVAAPLKDDQKWNTSWGIVAMGTMKPYSGTTITANVETTVTENINYQTIVGRRYRLIFRARASAPVTTAGYVYLRFNGSGIVANDSYRFIQTTYDLLDGEAVFPGTGGLGAYYVTAFGNQSFNLWTDQVNVGVYYLEDVGPVSAFAPVADPTPAWLPLTLINSWVSAGAIWGTPSYRKVGDIVTVRACISSGALGSSAFVLPVGYRSPVYLSNPSGGWGGSSTVFSRGYFDNNGAYFVTDGPTSSHTINFSFSVTP